MVHGDGSSLDERLPSGNADAIVIVIVVPALHNQTID